MMMNDLAAPAMVFGCGGSGPWRLSCAQDPVPFVSARHMRRKMNLPATLTVAKTALGTVPESEHAGIGRVLRINVQHDGKS